MTLLRRTAALLAITVVGSCSTTAPTAPNGFLTGTWFMGNTVEYMTITLTSSGGTAEGTVLDVLLPSPVQVKGTVTGTYGGGGFQLTLRFPAGTDRWFGDSVTWIGHVVFLSPEDEELRGEWHETAPVDSLLGDMWFFREPTGNP